MRLMACLSVLEQTSLVWGEIPSRAPPRAGEHQWMDERLWDSRERMYESLTDGCHHSLAFISSDLHPTDLNINCGDCGSNPFFWTSSHFYALFLLQAKADSLSWNSSCLSNIFPLVFKTTLSKCWIGLKVKVGMANIANSSEILE